MKRIMLVLIMFFTYCSVYSQPDTIWVANQKSSTENIAVSLDEKYVVTWGENGWRSEPGEPENASNLYGAPAKVFNAKTGEWIKTFYDSTFQIKNSVGYVSFSPDSSKMLICFQHSYTLVVDLKNNLNVIDQINTGGELIYSPDGKTIAANNTYFIDATTYAQKARFEYTIDPDILPNPGLSYQAEKQGIFRKNGREFVFPYEYTTNLPIQKSGSGWVIIDLIDSTIKVEKYKPFTCGYYRYGSKYYGIIEDKNQIGYVYCIRRYDNDSLVWKKQFVNKAIMQFTSDDNYLLFSGKFYLIPDTAVTCSLHHETYLFPSIIGNEYIYCPMYQNSASKRIMATKPCLTTGIAPIIHGQENTYPMPSKDKLNINIDLLPDNYTAEIHDLSGKKIEEINLGLKSGMEKIEINTNKLIPGTYILFLQNSNQTKTYKFIKE